MTSPTGQFDFRPGDPPGEFVVDLPSPRRPVTVAILVFWLLGWAFGLVFMIQQLLIPGRFGLDRVFLLVWMALWAAAGLLVLVYLAWLIAGRERVSIEDGALVLRRGVRRLWWKRRWPLASIRHLRTFGREVPPMIALGLEVAGRGASGVRFEAGGHVVRFARALSESDSRAVVQLLMARHPFDRLPPRDEPGRRGSHSAA